MCANKISNVCIAIKCVCVQHNMEVLRCFLSVCRRRHRKKTMQKVASLSESNAFFERLLAALESTTTDRGARALPKNLLAGERGEHLAGGGKHMFLSQCVRVWRFELWRASSLTRGSAELAEPTPCLARRTRGLAQPSFTLPTVGVQLHRPQSQI